VSSIVQAVRQGSWTPVVSVGWLPAMVVAAWPGNGHPYDWLVAISGFSYLLALAFFRWRG
jgi:hypothetical protein